MKDITKYLVFLMVLGALSFGVLITDLTNFDLIKNIKETPMQRVIMDYFDEADEKIGQCDKNVTKCVGISIGFYSDTNKVYDIADNYYYLEVKGDFELIETNESWLFKPLVADE